MNTQTKFVGAFLGLFLLLSGSLAFGADGDPDISAQAREKIVSESLAGQSQKAAVYVQGMVCTSCAIGVRVHLKKIDAVDRKQKNKGVALDHESQIAYIDLKAGKKLDPAQVREAIKKAGYKPVSLYVWNGKKVEKTQL